MNIVSVNLSFNPENIQPKGKKGNKNVKYAQLKGSRVMSIARKEVNGFVMKNRSILG